MSQGPKIYTSIISGSKPQPLERLAFPFDAFKKGLERFIAVCADAVPVNLARKTFWMPTRIPDSHCPGLWMFGGQRTAFSPSITGALSAIIKAETGLDIDPERLIFAMSTEQIHDVRAQDPADAGIHVKIDAHYFEITEEEIKAVVLSPKEYVAELGLLEYDRKGLEGLTDHHLQPYLLDLHKAIFSQP